MAIFSRRCRVHFHAIFGDALIPVWVRSLLALSIVVITAPLMPPMPEVELFSMTSLFLAFEQAIWGLMFGLILHMLFNVFTMLGQTISLQMGLGMAMMNDPVNGLSVAILGRMFLIFSTLLFLALEGHLLVIDIVIQSFVIWPVGSGITALSLQGVVNIFGWMFASALALALPAIVSMLLANISFGVMNRAAPSLNVYALGFPMTMLLGLFSVLISVSGVPSRYTALVHDTIRFLNNFMLGAHERTVVSRQNRESLPQKVKKARQEGQIPRAKEFTTAVIFLAVAMFFYSQLNSIWESMSGVFRYNMTLTKADLENPKQLVEHLGQSLAVIIEMLLPLFTVIIIVTFGSSMVLGAGCSVPRT